MKDDMSYTWQDIYWDEPDLSDLIRDFIHTHGGSDKTQDYQWARGTRRIVLHYPDRLSTLVDVKKGASDLVPIAVFSADLETWRNLSKNVAVLAAYDEERDIIHWARE